MYTNTHRRRRRSGF